MLKALVDRSLVWMKRNERYDLHELLRQYAADKLATDDVDITTTANRHLDYFLTLAERAAAHVDGGEQFIWFDMMEIELDNVRAALNWALRGGETDKGLGLASLLRWYWEYRLHASEGLEWLERFLRGSQSISPEYRISGLVAAGELAGLLQDNERSSALSLEALSVARQAHDRLNIAWALSTRGYWVSSGQSLDNRAEQLDESLELFREINDPFGLSHTLRRRADVAIEQEDYQDAQSLLDEALTRARIVGDKIAMAWVLYMLGDLAWLSEHDPERSKAFYQESTMLLREIGDYGGALFPLVRLARVMQSIMNNEQALGYYREAMITLKETSLHEYWYPLVRNILSGLAILAARQNLLERAVRLLGTVEAPVQEAEFSGFRALASDVESLRAYLGVTAFAVAWAEGKAMTREQAVAYALRTDISASEA
jgi:tetratricopeptide (TPR) repeat protein